jgi:biotin/methionine sulfoxide reductase
MRRTAHAAHWGGFEAETKAGRLVGIRPFAADEASSPLLRSVPSAVHAACRIDRPYIRRGWRPGGAVRGQARGGEPFVPIGWDEATRLVAGELCRVRAEHGPASIFGGSYGWSSAGRFHHARSQLHRMLAATGGFTGQFANYSFAAGMTLLPHILGDLQAVGGPVVDWRAIAEHAKLLVCFGGILLRNGQIGTGGIGRHGMGRSLRAAAAAGVRIVNISPLAADMPGDVAAKWLPIRPNTDAAMMLAMAHVLIAERRIDRDFLDRCTVGFETLRAEVATRTPAWAEAITGIPAETIASLARDCAAAPTTLTATWSLQRAEFGEQPFWALIALAALLGGIGKPGQGVAFGLGSMAGMGEARVEIPSVALPALRNPANSFIPVARLTEMLERPGGEYDFNGRRLRYPDARLIYWAGGNPLHHHQDLNRMLRAWTRAETIVAHEPWWTALARHADIVLPATTTLERDDIGSAGRDRFIFAMKRAIPPQAQARDDFSIFADIAEAQGAGDRFTGHRDTPAWLRTIYGTAQAAAARAGVSLPDFEAFWEAGHVEVPPPEERFVPLADFAADPDAHPLLTPSGRIEIASATIAGFGYPDCPGHPTWLAPREYLGAPLAARFPLHLLTVQPETRLHGQLDQAEVSLASKIAGREPITLHEDDAAARGLSAGDVVRAFNDRGACLAGLRTTRAMLRGVAVLATGAWLDPLEPGVPGSLCVHGNPNVLTQDVGTSRLGQGPSAQSCLIEVERWDGPLPPVRAHRRPPIGESRAG